MKKTIIASILCINIAGALVAVTPQTLFTKVTAHKFAQFATKPATKAFGLGYAVNGTLHGIAHTRFLDEASYTEITKNIAASMAILPIFTLQLMACFGMKAKDTISSLTQAQ